MSRVSSLQTVVINSLLFIFVFILLKNHIFGVNFIIPQGNFGLLLYILPGMITCFINRGDNVLALFIGALIGVPLCFLIRHYFLLEVCSYWQELAYLSSAVFWNMLGAMCVLLYRIWIMQFRRRD
ncbi:MAG: inner membrane protein YbjM [Rouxiella aceris]|uniref:inner membrane protein YbjM n=1 Tax=Rouxiella aceris TaxID=2703884 RepID=UPI00284E835F|nr:inner membrane protein YbjM [Rouxiella aceris]MDR3433091.1 inner membrane protein YbjM [Rouxiella aceris]